MTELAEALAGLAVAVACARLSGGARLSALHPPVARAVRPGAPALAASVLAALALAVIVGGPVGLLCGTAVAVIGPRVLGRLEPAGTRRERRELTRELPLLLDLLASCLAGGASLPAAGAAVASALPGPCASRLQAVVRSLAAGSPPEQAWLALGGAYESPRDVGAADDPLAATARLLARAAEGGTPVAAAVQRLAAEARAVAIADASQAARRVGVLVVAPLGLCFLPAFVLLGIVPVVAGLAGPLLRAG